MIPAINFKSKSIQNLRVHKECFEKESPNQCDLISPRGIIIKNDQHNAVDSRRELGRKK